MSMSPHQIFGRLQELKKWQHTHEKLLKRSSFDGEESLNKSNTSYGAHNTVKDHSSTKYETLDPDIIKCSPGLNFEDLLEEKLNEFDEDDNQDRSEGRRPKRPYLRKGSGLMKYNMKPEQYKDMIGNKFSNPIVPPKRQSKSIETTLKPVKPILNRPKTSCGERNSKLRKPQNDVKSSNNQTVRPRTSGGEYSRGTVGKKLQTDQRERKNLHVHHNDRKKTEINIETNQNLIDTIGDSLVPKTKEDALISECLKLKDFMNSISNQSAQFTPLKAPEMSIKPKGNWCDVSEKTSKTNSYDSFQYRDNIVGTQVVVQSQWKNGVLKGANQGNLSEMVRSDFRKDNSQEVDRIQIGARKNLSYENSDQSLYEKALETELMIFEALERRTEQSGFCSTNTSIIQLLASTPSKFNFKDAAVGGEFPVVNKIIDVHEEIDKHPVRDSNDHFKQVDQNVGNSLDHNFQYRNSPLYNELYKSDVTEEDFVQEIQDSEKEPNVERSASVNTNEIGIFRSKYSSESSDISEDSSMDSKVVGHSRNESSLSHLHGRSSNMSESCPNCGSLIRSKLDEYQSELDNLIMEKNRIIQIREKVTKEKLEFDKEMKKKRKELEDQRRQIHEELDEEKKKIEEKLNADKPQKEWKSKMQHKKDREEMNNLKMELNETKELMKLRDTKNAMSIARLRNQVKVLEKNNSELKAENEKLLKEKSKLAAQQRTHNKATETKMLKEISKNISKLTEETFKNQHFKTDTSSEEDIKHKMDVRRKSNESIQSSNKSAKLDYNRQVEVLGNDCRDERIGESNIEETYKSLFGGQDVIIEEGSQNIRRVSGDVVKYTGLGKTEKLLEDGTREIKYTNGNMKLILENGTVRYYYASNDTWHTNFPDGTEVIEFPNGQSEKKFKDGKCLIFFPDGLIQTIFPDGTEEVKYPDGSKLHTKKDGDRFLFLSNGQVEIHTKDQKRREYPDGTVKILYPDGSQETRYSNGRVRMKDSKGEVVLDTEESFK